MADMRPDPGAQPVVGQQVAPSLAQALGHGAGAKGKICERRATVHSSARWARPLGVASAAKLAAFMAPTDVPTTKSGRMPRSISARSIPTCPAPRVAPPGSTNATVPAPVPGAECRPPVLADMGLTVRLPGLRPKPFLGGQNAAQWRPIPCPSRTSPLISGASVSAPGHWSWCTRPLRAVGPVDGGAQGVCDAVEAAIEPGGTLLMTLGARDDWAWVNDRPEAERAGAAGGLRAVRRPDHPGGP